ncbi:MAG: DUF779 domain-containing protein [Cytophagales bacterium]|nr:MAG: DUF779 domain-containing protein [Cytophagales bacterium]
MQQVPRVLVSEEAAKIIDQLRQEHGELMFHQSGGCCDGSQPMCFAKGELRVGSNDVWIGNIHGCGFFMSADQFEYWKHTQLFIDITPGRGSSFSLEIPLGLRFIVKSRMYTEAEMENLSPIIDGEAYLELQV